MNNKSQNRARNNSMHQLIGGSRINIIYRRRFRCKFGKRQQFIARQRIGNLNSERGDSSAIRPFARFGVMRPNHDRLNKRKIGSSCTVEAIIPKYQERRTSFARVRHGRPA